MLVLTKEQLIANFPFNTMCIVATLIMLEKRVFRL